MKKYEYVWLDGYQPEPYLRSKVKVTTDRTPPEWSFDGSSTQQADTEGSDCILIPVQEYKNPLFGDLSLIHNLLCRRAIYCRSRTTPNH